MNIYDQNTTMCKVLNIGIHKDARQNENKIYRHCVGQCEWALRPKEFAVMNVIRAGNVGIIKCLL